MSSSYKKIFIWSVIIICVILMLLTMGNAHSSSNGFINKTFSKIIVSPQRWVTSFLETFDNTKASFGDMTILREKNEELQSELTVLELENDRLKLLEEENIRLTQLLETSESYPDYNKTTAKIIAKDASNWYDTFIIDKGQKDGVYENMVVIATGGLVGRVIESDYDYAKVVSIIDDTSSVSGIVVRTDSLGFVKGDYTILKDGYVKMEYFDVDAKIMENDQVVTSHLSEIYPRGISIGTIKEIYIDPSGLSKYALVQPSVDFKSLETVLVITDTNTKNINSFIEE